MFRFRIVGADGEAVRDYDLDGGVRLHLIVVRRDFVGYQHLHPTLGPTERWSVPLRLDDARRVSRLRRLRRLRREDRARLRPVRAGQLRPGAVRPSPHARVSTATSIQLTHDPLHAGRRRSSTSSSAVTVARFVRSRTTSATGATSSRFATGDLAYSHVHPEPTGAPGEIVFHTELATAGKYRVFLQFKRDGIVHTAPFTVEVER